MAGSPGDRHLLAEERSRSRTNSSSPEGDEHQMVASRIDESRSSRISTLENLFELLSGRNDVDYPICNDCAELLQNTLRARYDEACKERDVYIGFLNKINDEPGPGSEEVEELVKEIAELEAQSKQAVQDLKQAEQERLDVEQELEQLKVDAEELDAEEELFYKDQNKLYLELSKNQAEKERVDALYQYHTDRLENLRLVNVYNDIFCIGYDGHFGTINGLRLGKMKDRVDWPEISAAWGQTILLLATVVQLVNFKPVGYRLRPLGSMSRIEKLEADPKTSHAPKSVSLVLYFPSERMERYMNQKKLDAALVAFLSVLHQICQFVERSDPSLKAPYEIEKDKIGGQGIQLFARDATQESWTIACKYALTNAKWTLAYASTQ